MSIREIEEEQTHLFGWVRKFYSLVLAALLVVAILVPERYAVLIFLGAVVVILIMVSTQLLDIYYSNRAKLDTIISILSTISKRLEEGERESREL